jgi:hypothetical protein
VTELIPACGARTDAGHGAEEGVRALGSNLRSHLQVPHLWAGTGLLAAAAAAQAGCVVRKRFQRGDISPNV